MDSSLAAHHWKANITVDDFLGSPLKDDGIGMWVAVDELAYFSHFSASLHVGVSGSPLFKFIKLLNQFLGPIHSPELRYSLKVICLFVFFSARKDC